MDFWFPSSDCHPQVLKIHCENATETKKLQKTRKQRLILITLFFTYMLYKTTLHSITLLQKKLTQH